MKNDFVKQSNSEPVGKGNASTMSKSSLSLSLSLCLSLVYTDTNRQIKVPRGQLEYVTSDERKRSHCFVFQSTSRRHSSGEQLIKIHFHDYTSSTSHKAIDCSSNKRELLSVESSLYSSTVEKIWRSSRVVMHHRERFIYKQLTSCLSQLWSIERGKDQLVCWTVRGRRNRFNLDCSICRLTSSKLSRMWVQ